MIAKETPMLVQHRPGARLKLYKRGRAGIKAMTLKEMDSNEEPITGSKPTYIHGAPIKTRIPSSFRP